MPKVLIVEPEPALANFMRNGLLTERHVVEVIDNFSSANDVSLQHDYDLAVFDLNLPSMDGIEVLSGLREARPGLPVIVLTTRNHPEERVRVLEVGADDYLIKPFSFAELSARIRAVLRRGVRDLDSTLRYADLELNRISRQVTRNGKRVELTAREFALLEYLMRNSGRRVTRSMIMQDVWNLNFDTMTNVVDVYINYLRKKVDEGQPVRVIHTVRGIGYQLGTPQDAAS